MNMKQLLIIYSLICSAFAPTEFGLISEPEDLKYPYTLTSREVTECLDIPAYVTNMIFRNHPEKAMLRDLFLMHRYPHEQELDTVVSFYDRGYSLSVRDPLFLICCRYVADLADKRPENQPVVFDLGHGNGDSTILLSLLDANTIGIDFFMSEEEVKKCQTFLESAKKLAITFNQNCFCNFKNRDITQLDTTEFPDNCSDVIHMGNFLHMFDPFTARKIAQEQVHRMLKPDGVVFATVDGMGFFPGIQQAYLQRKANQAKFPTLFRRTLLRIVTQNVQHEEEFLLGEGIIQYECKDGIVDDLGRTAEGYPCRQQVIEKAFFHNSEKLINGPTATETLSDDERLDKNRKERELFSHTFPDYPGNDTPKETGLSYEQRSHVRDSFLRSFPFDSATEMTFLRRVSTVFCPYDAHLIDHVFPLKYWDISLGINIPVGERIIPIPLGRNPNELLKKWHITARKKAKA